MIAFRAESRCHGNSKQYIARLLGRASKDDFRREFTGRREGKSASTTIALIAEAGLFEACDIGDRGEKSLSYAIVLRRPPCCPPAGTDDPEFLCFWTDVVTASVLARRMDQDERLDAMVEILPVEGRDGYAFRIRVPGEAPPTSATITAEAAVEWCWAILQPLPQGEAEYALAALRARISPPDV